MQSLTLLKMKPHAACEFAKDFVIKAGFELAWVSMKSEARYYKYRGRHGVLRVATHSKGGRNEWAKDGPTLVSITFPDGSVCRDGYLHITMAYIENHCANAIGLYLIRSRPVVEPD